MAFAILVGSSWQELTGNFTVGDGDEAVTYPAGWLDGADDDTLIALGIAKIVEERDVAPCLQLLGQSIVDVDGIPHRRWIIPPAAEVRANRRGELASLRWEKQQTVLWDGRSLPADDTTIGRCVAARAFAEETGLDVDKARRWKIADGIFINITTRQIIAYGIAIGTHVQACYDRESDLTDAIAAATDAAAICAIDITGGWPA